MDAKADVTLPGGWFDRHREALASSELAAMPDTFSIELRTAAIRDPIAKLQELLTRGQGDVSCLHVQADGRIISADSAGIHIWDGEQVTGGAA